MKTCKTLCLLSFFCFCCSPFLLAQTVVAPYDILINEFMADPAPPVGLPNVEFIELFNRSNKTIQLKDFKIVNGMSVSTVLRDFMLKPAGYVVIYTKNGY